MQAPVDYPIVDSARNVQSTQDELTYAALLDRMASSQPVTQEMILQARLGIEMAQAIPDTPKPQVFSAPAPPAAMAQSLLAGVVAQRHQNATNVFSRWTRAIR